MPLMEWTEHFDIGIPSVDEQHKKLVEMLNELFESMQINAGREAIALILENLLLSTVDHFQYEEMLFEKTNYPLKQEHREEHQKLKEQALEIQKRFEASMTGTVSTEVMNFLRNWLMEHIEEADRKFVPHLLAHGVT